MNRIDQAAQVIRTRRSIRKYKHKDVSVGMLGKILEAGMVAPSAHNSQPWSFIVLRRSEVIGEIADIMTKDAGGLFSGFNIVMKDTADTIRRAPAIVLVYSDEKLSRRFAKLGTRYKRIGELYEVQSIAAAVENMLLCAHAMGLGGVWCGMALFSENSINERLGQENRLMAVLAFGYPDEQPDIPARKTVEEVAEYI